MRINTYFTGQTDVKSIILDLLDKAENQVLVAVAWFTQQDLFNKLIEIQRKGVNVNVIITRHEFNNLPYYLFENENGFFAEIGSDESLMHMKFCIIDFQTVISGSANWSNKAFAKNNEEVTIVEKNPQRCNEFIKEFTRLKQLSGKINDNEKNLEISKIITILKVIEPLINLGDTPEILKYAHRISNFPETNKITELLFKKNYESALNEIINFKKKYSQVVNIQEIEKSHIISQISLLSIHLEVLLVEKSEAEALINSYNHRYIIELNPILMEIWELRKKIFEKVRNRGVESDIYEEAEKEYQRSKREYNQEIKKSLPELNKGDRKTIKELYREGVKMCFPDSVECIFEDKKEASETFIILDEAYKQNNLEKVEKIVAELKLGNQKISLSLPDELDILRAKLTSLKSKYEEIIDELQILRNSEDYEIVSNMGDWNEYFKSKKQQLKIQLEELKIKFTKNE